MTALLYWKVITPPPSCRLAGLRRTLNEVFQATENVARYLVLNGVLQQCGADGGPLPNTGGTGQADFSNPDNSGLAGAI